MEEILCKATAETVLRAAYNWFCKQS